MKDPKNRKLRDGKMGPLQRALNDYLAATGNLQRSTSTLCIELWPQIVGPWYARKTQILSVENAEARVLCESPAVAQQLQADQQEIIGRLNDRLRGTFIRSLRASTVGRSASRVADRLRRPPRIAISDDELAQVTLTDEETAFCHNAARDIADEKLRQCFLKTLTNELKRRRLLQQRGYRTCTICAALHNEIGPYCIACATAVGSGAAHRHKE